MKFESMKTQPMNSGERVAGGRLARKEPGYCREHTNKIIQFIREHGPSTAERVIMGTHLPIYTVLGELRDKNFFQRLADGNYRLVISEQAQQRLRSLTSNEHEYLDHLPTLGAEELVNIAKFSEEVKPLNSWEREFLDNMIYQVLSKWPQLGQTVPHFRETVPGSPSHRCEEIQLWFTSISF